MNWFWHALVAWQIWRRLRLDRSIEDWIKARYVMVVTYAIAMGVALPAAVLARRLVRSFAWRGLPSSSWHCCCSIWPGVCQPPCAGT